MQRALTLILLAILGAPACGDEKPTARDGDPVSCGSGTELVDDRCVPSEEIECGAGTRLDNGVCTPISEVVCGDGTSLQGGVCVPHEELCSSGTLWVDGECVPNPDLATCGEGTELKDGECVPAGEATTCGSGTVLSDGVCLPNSQTHGTCGPGTELWAGTCVLAGSACGDGTVLHEGACVPEDEMVVCGEGTVLVEGVCVPRDEVICGEGTELFEGACVPTAPPCGDNTELVNGQCVPIETLGTCGNGTELVDGQCLPSAAVGVCGFGTVLVEGQCIPNSETHGTCGPGTQLQEGVCVLDDAVCGTGTLLSDGTCVAQPFLTSFEVTVAAEECDIIVAGLTPLRIDIRALDRHGDLMTQYHGVVDVSITGFEPPLEDSQYEITAGLGGTVFVPPEGAVEAGKVIVTSTEPGHPRGESAVFEVAAEEVKFNVAQQPDAVHAGIPFALTIGFDSNACGASDATEFRMGTVDLAVAAAEDATVEVLGRQSNGTLDAVLHSPDQEGSEEVELLVSRGADAPTTVTLTLVPAVDFGGIGTAVGLPEGRARVSWSAASGGDGTPFTYDVFGGPSPETIDYDTPLATTTETSTLIIDQTDGEVLFLNVRARDNVDDDPDRNTVALSVRPGPILFVAPGATGTTGTADEPVGTLSAALALVNGHSAIWLGGGLYAGLGATAVPDNIQILGGFDVDSNTPGIAGWAAGGATSTLQIDTPNDGLTLGAGARLSGFVIDPATNVGGAQVRVTGSNGVVSDVTLGGAGEPGVLLDGTTGGQVVDVMANGFSGTCVGLTNADARISRLALDSCGIGIASAGSTYALVASSVDADVCLDATGGGGTTVQRSSFTCDSGGVSVAGALRAEFSGNVVDASLGDCVALHNNTTSVVHDNTIDDCGAAGIAVGGHDTIDASVHGNTVGESTTTTGCGIDADFGGTGSIEGMVALEVSDNTLSDLADGICLQLTGFDPNGIFGPITVANNTVLGGDRGITVADAQFSQLNISHNVLSDVGIAIAVDRITGASRGVETTITNNVFDLCDSDISLALASVTSNSPVAISGNNIVRGANGTGPAIHFQPDWRFGRPIVVISDNSIDGGLAASADGIVVEGRYLHGDVTIQGNSLIGIDGTGITAHAEPYTALAVPLSGLMDLKAISNTLTDISGTAIDIFCNMNPGSDCSALAAANNINGADQGVIIDVGIEPSPTDPEFLASSILSAEGNTVSHTPSGALKLRVRSILTGDVRVLGNRIAGSGAFTADLVDGAAVTVETAANLKTLTTIINNSLFNSAGIALGQADAYDSANVFANNLVFETNGHPTAVNLNNADLEGTLEVYHNTLINSPQGIDAYIDTSGFGGVRGVFYNNLIVTEGEAIDLDFNGEAPKVRFNLFGPDAAAEGSNIAALPVFMTVPKGVHRVLAAGPNSFELDGDEPEVAVGDSILLGTEVAPRVVTSVAGDTAVFGGDPATVVPTLYSIVVWPAGQIGALPELTLAQGSPGFDGGDPDSAPDRDGSRADVGAFGGPWSLWLGRQ